MKVEQLLEKYYEEFVGLPNEHSIVRQNQKEDAYPLVVLDIIYSRELDLKIEPQNIDRIAKYIVAPPDDGIDMVVEHDMGDDYTYDIIQVKYSDLSEIKIKECFCAMKRTIDTYLKNPNKIQPNLRTVLDDTQFDSNAKSKIKYYVITNGTKNTFSSAMDDEEILNSKMLEEIYSSSRIEIPKVKYDELKSDAVNNFSLYSDNAYLINIRGYDLALLANKYDNTEIGRNILFGQNLRDSLESKSKTYDAMKKTIDNEPEQFWYYNNGITIVADDVDLKAEDGSDIVGQVDNKTRVDKIILRGFSIINGAQTTSSLGKYLKSAVDKSVAEAKLKKVYVFAIILRIVDKNTGDNIAIYNNMQNPITTRDMVSNNDEQRLLRENLLKDSPNIFMEIRRGTHIPPQPKILKHRQTTNEQLAQLCFAGYLQMPFIAKDRKKSLFNKDYNDSNYLINEYYDKIFNYEPDNPEKNGILFKKSNKEVDELLFVKYLYKDANKFLKQKNSFMASEINRKYADGKEPSEIDERALSTLKRNSEISNIALFYVITYYYCSKTLISFDFNIDVEKYYSDKEFQKNMIIKFNELFLSRTIRVIDRLSSGYASAASWIRSSKSQRAFLDEIANDISTDFEYHEKLKEFLSTYSKQKETT